MTASKVRAKVRRKIDEAEEDAEIGGEINLVPFLDIVINVIMFLLATMVAVLPMGNINVASPKYNSGGGGGEDQPPPEKPPLNLNVTVSGTGFIIAGSGGVMYQDNIPGKLPTVPKKGNEYDYPALIGYVGKIKEQFADESRVILAANVDIPYDVIVTTMDSLREKPGKHCGQSCKDATKSPQQCGADDLKYTGDCLFPEVMLGTGVE
ncbi:MAG: biopolymer transporter ExbD [Myxococcota bacterium]